MKITKLALKNYKKFNHWEHSFCDENGNPHEMILIVGSNGSGKSSILQAIAMLIGAAVKPFTSPSDLNYPGFRWDNIQRGRVPVDVRASIQFTDEEIESTKRFADEMIERFPEKKFPKPGNSHQIELHLDYAENKVVANSTPAFFQTKGYQYALQLSKFEQNFSQLFAHVGSIYVYHEQRTAASIDTSKLLSDSNGNGEPQAIAVDENLVKEVIFKWFVFHQNVTNASRAFVLREGQRDLFADLERRYQLLFPSRYFKGFAPQMMPGDFFNKEQDLWLFDGKNDYEFSEMSGGERAIFPLLIDFANYNINNSIIIIDEIELHLHPPLQQALVEALPKLGKNNQFIITTHSDYVVKLFPESQIKRLD